MSFLAVFVACDDFCVRFEPEFAAQLLEGDTPKRNRKRSLCLSEGMTLLIWFHPSGYGTFKDFSLKHVLVPLRSELAGLVSYTRFVEFIASALPAVGLSLKQCLGKPTRIAFVDSTPLKGCHNARIPPHSVCRSCQPRQEFDGVVLWLETAFDGQ